MTNRTTFTHGRYEELRASVRSEFTARGESIADWSKRQGFRPYAVYQVLSGRTLATRGEAHRIAVALGLKPEPLGPPLPISAEENNM
ncbi:DNA-binding protein [Roseateles sp. UC29_93]|uniref:DNA-binding protein n=1 Tax=Roseateles sp. UC29_93 TaxID=3350177 RepID=UPI0036700B01